ncbi:MAG: ABC transporter permease, partial [Vicinamibacterales bacterium]
MAWPWRRRNFESEMAEELRAHVAHRADDLEAAGMTRPGAERQARIELGGIETHKEDMRDERLFGRMLRFIQQTANDLRLGARRLRYAPLYALFAIGSIGLGAGVTTAMFSIVSDAFWAPSGIHEASRVVVAANQLEHALAFERAMSVADFEDYRHAQTSFDSMAAATRFSQSLSMPVGTQLVTGEAVTDTYFQTLGVTASAGRVLQPADGRPDAPLVMVLSHQVWRRWFASDPNVVGQVVRFGSKPFQIIGVAAREYRGLNSHPGRVTGVWIPLAALSQMPVYGSPADPATARTRLTMMVAGRLKADVPDSRAEAEAVTIGSGLDTSFPLTAARWNGTASIRVPAKRQWTLRLVGRTVPIPIAMPGVFIGIVALVLIVACTNLANLSLARGASREAELAVRLALGASRGRLIRELSAESLVVGAGGFLVAVPIVLSLMRLAGADWFALSGSAAVLDPHLSLPVFAACAIAVMLSVLVCGLWPAVRLSRTD